MALIKRCTHVHPVSCSLLTSLAVQIHLWIFLPSKFSILWTDGCSWIITVQAAFYLNYNTLFDWDFGAVLVTNSLTLMSLQLILFLVLPTSRKWALLFLPHMLCRPKFDLIPQDGACVITVLCKLHCLCVCFDL